MQDSIPAQHSGRLTIFQSCALRDVRINNVHIMALAMLGQHSDRRGYCWPKLDTMAKQRGISHQAISKAIRYLVACGYVEVRKFREGEDSYLRNGYRLLLDYDLPEEYDRCLNPEESDPQTADDLAEAGMITETAQSDVARSATSAAGPRNVTLRNNVPMNDPLSNVPSAPADGAASGGPSGKPKGVSLGPLAEAFTARGLPSPRFTGPEVGAAQLLIRDFPPPDVAECWHDIVTGSYGNDFARSELSFRYLSTNNRVDNWRRWRDEGRPGKGNGSNGPKNGNPGTRREGPSNTGTDNGRRGPDQYASFARTTGVAQSRANAGGTPSAGPGNGGTDGT